MSLFRNNNIIGFIVLFFIVSAAWGQTPPKPTICTTPPSGYRLGGDISLGPPISCVTLGNNALTLVSMINKNDPNVLGTNVKLDNPVFYIDVDNNTDITTGGHPAVNNSYSENLTVGSHWILLKGDKNGQKYLTCVLQENIRTSDPIVTASACNANSVTLTIPVDPENQHNLYTINWGDGSAAEVINVNSTPLPYTKTKTYTGTHSNPTVQGKYIRNSTSVCLTSFYQVIPDATASPLINGLDGEAEGKEATLTFVGHTPGSVYKIEGAVDNGTGVYNWRELADGLNGTAKVTGLDPNLKYCFRTKTKNSCNVDVFSINTICSINLKANLKSSSAVDLKWNLPSEPNSAPTKLSLAKEQKGTVNSSNNNPITNTTTTSWTDSNLDCSYFYLYRISARFASISLNGTLWPINIKSPQITVDPKSNAVTIKPNDLVTVGYDPNDDRQIRVSIAVDPNNQSIKGYTFFRAENDSQVFTKLGTRTTNVFDDITINEDIKSYCYKYQTEDKCGVISEMSDPFCTIMLNSKAQGTLNWTPYLIPPAIFTSATPVEYSVEYFDEALNSYIPFKTTNNLEQAVQDLLNSSGQSEIKFRVMGRQFVDTPLWANQFINSYSNPFTIKVPPGIYIPTAFTPNGDGENEKFGINVKFVSDATFKIFDRWGGTVFEGLAMTDEWDGTQSNGITPAPAGTYAYVINATSDSGQTFRLTGSVLLLR